MAATHDQQRSPIDAADAALDRRTNSRAWMWPFVLILLAPVVTSTVTMFLTPAVAESGPCQMGDAQVSWFDPEPFFLVRCNPFYGALTLAPGLLNLSAFLWLRSTESRTRAAARWAGTLGLIRWVVPTVVLVLAPEVVINYTPGGGAYVLTPDTLGVGAVLWLLSVVAMVYFGATTPES